MKPLSVMPEANHMFKSVNWAFFPLLWAMYNPLPFLTLTSSWRSRVFFILTQPAASTGSWFMAGYRPVSYLIAVYAMYNKITIQRLDLG